MEKVYTLKGENGIDYGLIQSEPISQAAIDDVNRLYGEKNELVELVVMTRKEYEELRDALLPG